MPYENKAKNTVVLLAVNYFLEILQKQIEIENYKRNRLLSN